MASEYTLSLKAVLDTTEVQQKLQQLKNQQTKMNEQQSGQAGSSSNLSNLAQLKSSISKLDASILSLQKTLQRQANSQLNNKTLQNQQQVAREVQSLAAARQVIVPPSSQPFNQSLPIVDNKVAVALEENAKKLANAVMPTKEYEKLIKKVKAGKASFQKQMDEYIAAAGLSPTDEQVIRMRMGVPKTREPIPPVPTEATPKNNSLTLNKLLQNRKFAAIVGGQLLGGAGSLAEDFGFKKTGIVLNALGTGLTAGGSAAYTGQLFGMSDKAAGRLGIAAGLIAAAADLVDSFYKLKDAAEIAAKAQREIATKQREQAFELQGARNSFFDSILAKNVLKTQNADIAQARLEYSKSVSQYSRNKLESMEDPALFERKIRERVQKLKEEYNNSKTGFDKFADQMTTIGYAFNRSEFKDTEHAYDAAGNKVIEMYQKRFQAALKEAQAAEATTSMWQSVVDNLKEAHWKSKESISRMRIEEAQKKNAAFENARQQDWEFRWSDQMRATQILAMQTLRTDVNKLTPKEQFKILADELDKLRESRNSSLREAYQLNRQIFSRPEGINGNAYQDLVKRRDQALREAQNFESRAGVIENAISRIQNIVSQPDLSHMTSLAQYGFNMGEKDDTVQAMEKYYSKMTDLTKQIRDKIDQGITTTATYD